MTNSPTRTPSPTEARAITRLPLELRWMIYEQAMAEMPQDIILQAGENHSPTDFPAVLPSFAFTNKQAYEDIFPAFIPQKRFCLGPSDKNAEVLNDFLERVPEERGFRLVRKLLLSLGCQADTTLGSPAHPPPKFLPKCVALRELSIEIPMLSPMTWVPGRAVDARHKTQEELEAEYKHWAPSWSSWHMLQSFTLVCPYWHEEETVYELMGIYSREQFFSNVVSFFQGKAREINKRVEFRVEYKPERECLEGRYPEGWGYARGKVLEGEELFPPSFASFW